MCILYLKKLFEGVKAVNHSYSKDSFVHKLRINGDVFDYDSITYILEHVNYIALQKSKKFELMITVQTAKIADDANLLIFESILYYLLKKYDCKIFYTFVLKGKSIGYKMFEMSNLYKYNNKYVDRDSFILAYENENYVTKNHLRKMCNYSVDNVKNEYLSIMFTDVSMFLRNCNIEEKYSNDLSEAIVEIVGNALEHSCGSCILDIKILFNTDENYNFINVTTLSVGDIFVGSKIAEYIENYNDNCYNSSNIIVIDAYNNHKNKFNEFYDLSTFTVISAFQKYVTTRLDSSNSGGTGLTTLIKQLIAKADGDYCYLRTGDDIIFFKDQYLKLTEDGLIGFNESNDYIGNLPSSEVATKMKNKLNATIYNLQFVLKEKGRDE